jgi:hypothetical protein
MPVPRDLESFKNSSVIDVTSAGSRVTISSNSSVVDSFEGRGGSLSRVISLNSDFTLFLNPLGLVGNRRLTRGGSVKCLITPVDLAGCDSG